MTDARTGVTLPGAPRPTAKPGDVAICGKCAGLSIFTQAMGQRKMTYLEQMGVNSETKKLLEKVRSAVREVNRR
jgi:hypothetical protein